MDEVTHGLLYATLGRDLVGLWLCDESCTMLGENILLLSSLLGNKNDLKRCIRVVERGWTVVVLYCVNLAKLEICS